MYSLLKKANRSLDTKTYFAKYLPKEVLFNTKDQEIIIRPKVCE